ncbi:hypothetical protein AJ87_10430 [Rhizobium yanglingense]|nr:hypothetical protein AJ87_10430 [Rhizobium yanglingense]
MEGAGDWAIASQSGHVSPASTTASRRNRSRPTAHHDDALAFGILRPGLAHRPLAHKSSYRKGLGRGHLSSQFILFARRHHLLELQLQLIDQPCFPFTARSMLLALQLSDQQSQLRKTASVLDNLAFALAASASTCSRASRSASRAA